MATERRTMNVKVGFLVAILLVPLMNGFSQPVSTFQLAWASYTVAENGGSGDITVTRSGDTSSMITVDYTTRDGTATAGADYNAQSGTLTFAAGETNNTFAIPIIDDGFVEDDETVNLTLSNPTGGAMLGAQSNAVLTIRDNEIPIVVDTIRTVHSIRVSLISRAPSECFR